MIQTENTTQPDRLVPITTYSNGQYIKIDGIGTHDLGTIRINDKDWTETIVHEVVGDITNLMQWMTNEQIILLSDASVKQTSCMAAWIVTTANAYGNNNYIKGYGKIFEHTADSHRAECFGILGALHTFFEFKQTWSISYNIPIMIVCDNKAAINYVGDTDRYPYIHSRFPDFDVLQAIRYTLKNENIQYRHVKGHGEKSARPWDIFTTINIQVDELADDAEERWQQNTTNVQGYAQLPGEEWQIICSGDKVYKNIDETIRNFITEQSISEIWNKYKRVTLDWFQEVNWTAIGSVMKKTSNSTKHWIIKRCAQECGSNFVRQRRKEIETNSCPFCQEPETVEHIYKCKHSSVTELWDKAMHELEEYLNTIQTDPNITKQLIQGIHMWRNNVPLIQEPMIIDQHNIGWNGIMEGVMGQHWAEEQEWYKQQHPEAKSGQQWAQLVIRRLWKIAWDLWQHRNEMEHKNDQQLELAQLQVQAKTEIEIGHRGYTSLKFLFTSDVVEKVIKGNKD
jgi:hypothetical protein